jgi:predicted  nucleic acid-binding Zn-ribbon protein
MDDTVQIRCTRCKTVFRDRAHRLQSGYSRQCPCCEVILFFEETSADRNIKRALTTARHLRTALREADFMNPRKARAVEGVRRTY